MSILDATHVGYTGTSKGMTDNQLTRFRDLLIGVKDTQRGPHWLHHGDCVGGDAQAHRIARTLGYHIWLHPPEINTHRAFCDWDQRDLACSYLKRDDEIARWSIYGLFGAPRTSTETLRSGTWTTIRYALKRNKRVLVIPPHGVEFRYTESVLP